MNTEKILSDIPGIVGVVSVFICTYSYLHQYVFCSLVSYFTSLAYKEFLSGGIKY